jgi:hypothetical protein
MTKPVIDLGSQNIWSISVALDCVTLVVLSIRGPIFKLQKCAATSPFSGLEKSILKSPSHIC